MEKEQLVAYCGLYCGPCDHRTKIPKFASALREAMKEQTMMTGWLTAKCSDREVHHKRLRRAIYYPNVLPFRKPIMTDDTFGFI